MEQDSDIQLERVNQDLSLLEFIKLNQDNLLSKINESDYKRTFKDIKLYINYNYDSSNPIQDNQIHLVINYFIHHGFIEGNYLKDKIRKKYKFEFKKEINIHDSFEDNVKTIGLNENSVQYLFFKYLTYDLNSDKNKRIKYKQSMIKEYLNVLDEDYTYSKIFSHSKSSINENEDIIKLFDLMNIILKDDDFADVNYGNIILMIYLDSDNEFITEDIFLNIFKDLEPEKHLDQLTVFHLFSCIDLRKKIKNNNENTYIEKFIDRNINLNQMVNNLSHDIHEMDYFIRSFDLLMNKIDFKKIDIPLLINKIETYENFLEKEFQKVKKVKIVKNNSDEKSMESLFANNMNTHKDNLIRVKKIYRICNELNQKKKISGIKLRNKI